MTEASMARVPHLHAVVVAYNQLEQTLTCLQTLSRVTYPAWTIVMVDNGSYDGTTRAIVRSFPDVEVLHLNENQGYVGGANTGVAHALAQGADYVLLLNNDVYIPPYAPSVLVEMAEADPSIAALGPKVYYADDPQRLQSVGGAVNWRTMRSELIGEDELEQGQYDHSRSVDFVSGCAMLICAQAWYTIGEFDPVYFLYYEEVDWCLRAKQAGWDIVYSPHAAVWHMDQESSRTEPGLVTYYTTRNWLILAQRYADRRTRLAVYADALWRATRSLRHLRVSSPRRPHATATLQAVADFFRGRFGRGPYPKTQEACLHPPSQASNREAEIPGLKG